MQSWPHRRVHSHDDDDRLLFRLADSQPTDDRITFSEWQQYIYDYTHQAEDSLDVRDLRDRYTRYDNDGDGVLSFEESVHPPMRPVVMSEELIIVQREKLPRRMISKDS